MILCRWDKECSLQGHRGCVNALNFNESGTVLVSAGDDLNVILWDWLTKKEKTKYESGHHSNVFQVSLGVFSSNGKIFGRIHVILFIQTR